MGTMNSLNCIIKINRPINIAGGVQIIHCSSNSMNNLHLKKAQSILHKGKPL